MATYNCPNCAAPLTQACIDGGRCSKCSSSMLSHVVDVEPAPKLDCDPKLYLLSLIADALLKVNDRNLADVSFDNDNDSGELIVDFNDGDKKISLVISTASIRESSDECA